MTARGNSGRSSGASNAAASTRPPASRNGTTSLPTTGVSIMIRRASSAGISLSGVDGAMALDRQHGAPPRVARDGLRLQHGQPPRQLDAQVVAGNDGVDMQVGRQL